MAESLDPIRDSEAQIAARVNDYVNVLTVRSDAEAARDFYTDDVVFRGPGFEFDQDTVVKELEAAFSAGAQIEVERTALELYVHGNVAYEIAEAEDTLRFPDGSSQSLRNRMFIRWERGDDGVWRFSRVLLSPKDLADPGNS